MNPSISDSEAAGLRKRFQRECEQVTADVLAAANRDIDLGCQRNGPKAKRLINTILKAAGATLICQGKRGRKIYITVATYDGGRLGFDTYVIDMKRARSFTARHPVVVTQHAIERLIQAYRWRGNFFKCREIRDTLYSLSEQLEVRMENKCGDLPVFDQDGNCTGHFAMIAEDESEVRATTYIPSHSYDPKFQAKQKRWESEIVNEQLSELLGATA